MTRGNLMLVTVLVVAIVAMFFWTLNLQHRQEQLYGSGEELTGPGPNQALDARIRELESRYEELPAQVLENSSEVGRLTQENRTLSAKLSELEARVSGGGEGTPVAGTASDAQIGDGAVRAAVDRVLEERQVAERQARNERMAQGFSRWLLRDVAATDEQRDQFVKVVAAYFDGRGKIFEKYSGDNADDQSRDQEVQRLEEDRNAKLLTIFGAADYAKIEEGLNRGNRAWRGGRGGGGRADRGSRRGGAPGTPNGGR